MGLPLRSQACRPRGRKNHSPSEQQERGPSSRNPAGSGGNDSHANGTHGDLGAGGRLRGPQREESGRAVCPFWLQYEGQVGRERGFGQWTLIHHGTPVGWGESPLWKPWAREVSRLAQGLRFVGTGTRIQSLVPTTHRAPPLDAQSLPTLTSSLGISLGGAHVCKAPLSLIARSRRRALLLAFPIAKSLLYAACLRKHPKDDVCISTRTKCWGHRREVSETVAGKTREGFS